MERIGSTSQVEVLSSYSKAWEKASNNRATEDVISQQISELHSSAKIFAASDQPFPSYLTTTAHHTEPSQGILDLAGESDIPTSLLVNPSNSYVIPPPVLTQQTLDDASWPQSLTPQLLVNSTFSSPIPMASGLLHQQYSQHSDYTVNAAESSIHVKRRRRVVAEGSRKRQLRTCRRCGRSDCPGGSDILNCQTPCMSPCKKCGRTEGCRGVDRGQKCTWIASVSS